MERPTAWSVGSGWCLWLWLMLVCLSVLFFLYILFGIRLNGVSFLVGLGPRLICSWRGPKAPNMIFIPNLFANFFFFFFGVRRARPLWIRSCFHPLPSDKLNSLFSCLKILLLFFVLVYNSKYHGWSKVPEIGSCNVRTELSTVLCSLFFFFLSFYI